MNTNNKPTVSRTVMKIVMAVAITLGLLAILSGVLFSLDREISVQSRVAPVNNRQSFASLPEYGYIQAHQASNVQPVKPLYVYDATGAMQTAINLPTFDTLAKPRYIYDATGAMQAAINLPTFDTLAKPRYGYDATGAMFDAIVLP